MNVGIFNPEGCPLCFEKMEDGGDVCEICQKGADGINTASVQRGDTIVLSTYSTTKEKWL